MVRRFTSPWACSICPASSACFAINPVTTWAAAYRSRRGGESVRCSCAAIWVLDRDDGRNHFLRLLPNTADVAEHNRSASASLGGPAPLETGTSRCPEPYERLPLFAAGAGIVNERDQPFAMSDFVGMAIRRFTRTLELRQAPHWKRAVYGVYSPAALREMAANFALLHGFQPPPAVSFPPCWRQRREYLRG